MVIAFPHVIIIISMIEIHCIPPHEKPFRCRWVTDSLSTAIPIFALASTIPTWRGWWLFLFQSFMYINPCLALPLSFSPSQVPQPLLCLYNSTIILIILYYSSNLFSLLWTQLYTIQLRNLTNSYLMGTLHNTTNVYKLCWTTIHGGKDRPTICECSQCLAAQCMDQGISLVHMAVPLPPPEKIYV